MGLFSRFKKAPEGGPSDGDAIAALAQRFGLTKRRSSHPAIIGSAFEDWWEGTHNARRVAVLPRGAYGTGVYGGEFEDEVGLMVLGRMAPGRPVAARGETAIPARPPTAELARVFAIEMLPNGPLEEDLLIRTGLAEALAALPAAANTVTLYDAGVEINFPGRSGTLEELAQAMDIAVRIAKTLR